MYTEARRNIFRGERIPCQILFRDQVRWGPRIDHMDIIGDFDQSGFGVQVRMKVILRDLEEKK